MPIQFLDEYLKPYTVESKALYGVIERWMWSYSRLLFGFPYKTLDRAKYPE